jgi:uncharacterized protein (TIGR02118 family)
MIKVSVLFPETAGARFDKAYFFSKHLPLVARLVGPALKGISIEEGISGAMPGSPAPYLMASHFSFDSVDAFQAAFFPHAEAIMQDLAKVTPIEAVVQIGDVKYAR